MSSKLSFSNLALRHPGISQGLSLACEEAARVCLDRHHSSPIEITIDDSSNVFKAEVVWLASDRALLHQWANDTDATEQGATALALACVELSRGLVAIRRAETRTGADYYVSAPGTPGDDLESAVRLEISGTSDESPNVLKGRLKRKLAQAANGRSNVPAMAIVVGFPQKRILSADVK